MFICKFLVNSVKKSWKKYKFLENFCFSTKKGLFSKISEAIYFASLVVKVIT
jgi:hypothetical protein